MLLKFRYISYIKSVQVHVNIIFFRKNIRKRVEGGTQTKPSLIPVATDNTTWQTSPTSSAMASVAPTFPDDITPICDPSANMSVESVLDNGKCMHMLSTMKGKSLIIWISAYRI